MTKCRGILVLHEDGTAAGCTAQPCPGAQVERHHVVVRCHAYGDCPTCASEGLARSA
ncbi:MAG: hypothetical protein M0Z63_12380 [Actinomycetota bacterium]|nr:hypothetical protein [Actinomycetota bacterium]